MKTLALFVFMGSVLMGGSGCGGLYYAITAGAASSRLAEARELGAEKFAAYEYTYAEEHLRQASRKASTSGYGDAADMAEEAERMAIRAAEITRHRRGLAVPSSSEGEVAPAATGQEAPSGAGASEDEK